MQQVSYIWHMNNAQNAAAMTIEFNLSFNISSSVFIANAERNAIPHFEADNFIGFVFGNLDQVTPDHVERFVKKHVEEPLQAMYAQRIMKHLLMCHNLTVKEADRRFK